MSDKVLSRATRDMGDSPGFIRVVRNRDSGTGFALVNKTKPLLILKEITMSDRNTMAQRGRDLEDAFFHDVDLKLIEELRAASKNKASRLALAKEAGISDERLAEELVELDVTPESLVAIRLVPLVMVAWADREVSDEERDTVIAEARRLGIHPGTVADKMLDSWLRKRPSQVLCDAWARYTRSLLLDIRRPSIGRHDGFW